MSVILPVLARFARFSGGFAAACLALAAPLPAAAQGDLLVAPTRVIMSGGSSSEVVLNNIGATPATYRIALELRRMTADGDLEVIEEANYTPEQQAIVGMFRYAPRRIVLPPNQPQSVRISARPPEGLADGEYRVHMSFRAVPDAKAVETSAEPPSATGLTIRLTPIYGVTIPVILRRGQLTGGAAVEDAAVIRDGAETALKVSLGRTGNRSIYGEIRVIAPGAKQPAFLVRGIAIYPELTHRTLQVALTPAQVAAIKGPMQVEYREMPEAGGKLIAAKSVTF